MCKTKVWLRKTEIQRKKTTLSYIKRDSFIGYIKVKGSYSDIVAEVETKFDVSIYEFDRLLPKGKNKEIIGLMTYKQEVGDALSVCVLNILIKVRSLPTLLVINLTKIEI